MLSWLEGGKGRKKDFETEIEPEQGLERMNRS